MPILTGFGPNSRGPKSGQGKLADLDALSYESLQPSGRPGWVHMDDAEILLAYNAEMRGLANYYALANGAKRGLQKLMYLAESSFLATLAWKHKTSVSQISSKFRQGRDLGCLKMASQAKFSCPEFGPHSTPAVQYLGTLIGCSA